jgi:hypothetical protein
MTPTADVTESSRIADAIRPTSVGRIASSIALVVALAVTAVACSSSGSAAIPDTLSTAIDQMQIDDTYDFEATMTTATGSVAVDGTFAAPNTVTQTIRVPGRAPVELRLIGSQVSVKDPATGGFTASSAASSSSFDLRGAFTALRSARSISTSGETFSFTLDPEATQLLAGADATGSAEVSVTTGESGLATLVYRVTVGGRPMTVTINYRQS